MGARRYVALIATLLACIATAQADALRVLYAEPFQPAIEGRGTTLEKLRAAPRMRIDAFGRRFDLELADNTALLRAARISADQRDSIALFKGSLRDAPGSWVRLALIDGRYEGAFWDGADLYAISARSTIEAELLAPLAASSSASAIYRLSDTQDGLLAGTCAAESQTPSRSSLSRYRNLVNELKAAFAEKTTASQEVTVAMVGDFEFVNRTGANALVSLITRANVVDGIFSDQVGISIVPTDFITYSSDIDSFTSSDAPTLLSQVADFKESRGDLSGRGIVHLVTGRPLDGSTVGIAYLNSVCHTRAGS